MEKTISNVMQASTEDRGIFRSCITVL